MHLNAFTTKWIFRLHEYAGSTGFAGSAGSAWVCMDPRGSEYICDLN